MEQWGRSHVSPCRRWQGCLWKILCKGVVLVPPSKCLPSAAQSLLLVPHQVAQDCHLSHSFHLTLVHQLHGPCGPTGPCSPSAPFIPAIPCGPTGLTVPCMLSVCSIHSWLALWSRCTKSSVLARFTRQCLNSWVSRSLATDSLCCFFSEGLSPEQVGA